MLLLRAGAALLIAYVFFRVVETRFITISGVWTIARRPALPAALDH